MTDSAFAIGYLPSSIIHADFIPDHQVFEAFSAQSPSAHLPVEAREAIYRVVMFRLASI
jgi:hypothetical protein